MGYQPIKCRSGHDRGGEAERDGACEPNAKWNDFLVYDDLRWVCRRSPPHPTRCPFVSVLQDTIAAGTRARPCPRQPSAALLEEEEDAGMIGEEVATASAGSRRRGRSRLAVRRYGNGPQRTFRYGPFLR